MDPPLERLLVVFTRISYLASSSKHLYLAAGLSCAQWMDVNMKSWKPEHEGERPEGQRLIVLIESAVCHVVLSNHSGVSCVSVRLSDS